jgi:hypothetical protein
MPINTFTTLHPLGLATTVSGINAAVRDGGTVVD